MFPTRKQFRRWSYPSKFAFVSVFVGLGASLVFWLFPDAGKGLVASLLPPGTEQALVGTWQGTTTYKSSDGDMLIAGYTRLLSTGHYNFSGDMEVRLPNQLVVKLGALAAGTWKANGNRFVLTASEVKTVLRTIHEAGNARHDLSRLLRIAPHLASGLEQTTPRGASQEFEIVELTAERLRAKSTDIRGVGVTYEATRQ